VCNPERQLYLTNKLYLTNLSAQTTEAELRQIFGQVGEVVSVRIVSDPRSPARMAFAFVEMETSALTKAAMDKVTGHLLHDRRIQINELHKPNGREVPMQFDDTPKQARRPKNASNGTEK
jgi:RNA recognition motif-containing protein